MGISLAMIIFATNIGIGAEGRTTTGEFIHTAAFAVIRSVVSQ